nr:hypothetical protein [Acidiferrobacter sp.]
MALSEDDPDRDLVYDACGRTPVCARLERAPWIYQGSFSKTLAPGLRRDYLAAAPEPMPLLTRLKQAADLHSNRIGQWLVLPELNRSDYDRRIAALAQRTRNRRDAFEIPLRRHVSGAATWQTPPGGLFFWLTRTRRIDTRLPLSRSLEAGAAFMPGGLSCQCMDPLAGKSASTSPCQRDAG